MTALLDPAALMQLQMAQRKPEVRWLAGAPGLGAAGQWLAAFGQVVPAPVLHGARPLCSHVDCKACAALSEPVGPSAPSPNADEGLWVDVASASAFTLAGLLAQAAGEDAVPGEHGRQPGGLLAVPPMWWCTALAAPCGLVRSARRWRCRAFFFGLQQRHACAAHSCSSCRQAPTHTPCRRLAGQRCQRGGGGRLGGAPALLHPGAGGGRGR